VQGAGSLPRELEGRAAPRKELEGEQPLERSSRGEKLRKAGSG